MNALGQIIAYISRIMAILLNFFNTTLSQGLGLKQSWGLSVILLTFVVRLLLFPSSIKQTRSMEEVKKIQPLLKEIQEKYKDQPEEYQKKTLEVYKKSGVNPFGGCLPMLLQLPILMALYQLLHSPAKFDINLSHASFLWIGLMDAGKLTSNGILAVLSAATTYWLQKITSTSTGNDPVQKNTISFVTGITAYFTYIFSAGLGIYWVTNNIISIIQHWIILRYFIKNKEVKD